MKFLLPLFVPVVLLAQASPGSLFSPAGPLAEPARDLRAGAVGDVLTILVSDRASAIARRNPGVSKLPQSGCL